MQFIKNNRRSPNMTGTRIIEFCGLPGSGKSTISHYLASNLLIGKNVAEIYDARKLRGLWNVAKIFSIRSFLLFLKSIPIYSFVHIGKIHYLLSPYKKSLTYDCIKTYSNYDYVFVHHGILQSYVSALYGNDGNMEKYKKEITAYLKTVNVDMVVYIQTSIETAYERIKKRNQKDHGRLDALDNEAMLLALQKQKVNFDHLAEMSDMAGINTISLNGENTIEEIIEESLTYGFFETL